jgi:hypothetical protein
MCAGVECNKKPSGRHAALGTSRGYRDAPPAAGQRGRRSRALVRRRGKPLQAAQPLFELVVALALLLVVTEPNLAIITVTPVRK